MYTKKPRKVDLRPADIAQAYPVYSRKAAYQSTYLVYLGQDVTKAVANSALLGVGLAASCANAVEGLNGILKGVYNDRWVGECRGQGKGGRGKGHTCGFANLGVGVWKCHLLLRNYGPLDTAPCTMARLKATQSPPPSRPPCQFLCHLATHHSNVDNLRAMFAKMLQANSDRLVCFALHCAHLCGG